MTDKITLNDVTTFQNDTSAATLINDNSDTIVNAFDRVLFTDGTAPNAMQADLDMNSNQILNLPAPSTADSPARIQDLANVVADGEITFTTNVTNNTTNNNYPPGVVSMSDLGTFYTDGVTANDDAFGLMTQTKLVPLTKSFPLACTITIASPAVVTTTYNHGFLQGQAFQFSTTGTLPTGILANTTYYVILAGLTLNSFQFSTQNPCWSYTFPNPSYAIGDGTAINTSGSQSGTLSIIPLGQEWINMYVPPGRYHNATDTTIFGATLAKKLKVDAYGMVVDNLGLSNQFAYLNGVDYMGSNYFTIGTGQTAYVSMLNSNDSSFSVTLETESDNTKFYPGQWALISALDLQGENSYPPNNHYLEYNKIVGISGSTITFEKPLKNNYRSNFPSYYAGTPLNWPTGGPAMITGLGSGFDFELEVNGLSCTDYTSVSLFRSARFKDCQFGTLISGVPSGNSAYPSMLQKCVFDNCIFEGGVEVDKLIEYLEYKDCVFKNGTAPYFQSSSTTMAVIDGCTFGTGLAGTPRNIVIRNSFIPHIDVSPLAFGCTDSILIENTVTNSLSTSPRLFNAVYGGTGIECSPYYVNNMGFSNGTLSVPLAQGPVFWAVPGRKMFVTDVGGVNASMGTPFAILDVRTDGTNTLVDTTLASQPVGSSTNSTVTMTVASPAVVTWTSHGLTAGTVIYFSTTGTLPTGMSAGQIYYVLASGLTTNTFEFSASAGGSAIVTTGSQSGTHACVANGLIYTPHPCPRMTVRNSTGCAAIVAQSQAPPDSPMYSYDKRTITTNGVDSAAPGAALYSTGMFAMGYLKSLVVDVKRPYTGSSSPMQVTITAKGFDSDFNAVNFSQVIDLTVVGKRTITPFSAIGVSGAADTIAAYSSANWLEGKVNVTSTASALGFYNQMAEYTIEIQTDQGIIASPILQSGGYDYYGAYSTTADSIISTSSPASIG